MFRGFATRLGDLDAVTGLELAAEAKSRHEIRALKRWPECHESEDDGFRHAARDGVPEFQERVRQHTIPVFMSVRSSTRHEIRHAGGEEIGDSKSGHVGGGLVYLRCERSIQRCF